MASKSRSAMLTYVLQTFKRTDKNTEAYHALDEVILDISSRHPFEVLAFQSWVNTVQGQEDYPLPDNLMHLRHPIRILEGSGTNDDGWPLQHLSKEQFDWYEPNPNRTSPSTGQPWGYAIFSDSILLTDIPDSSSWIIEINWNKEPTLPTADGDTSHPFGVAWDETIKWGILARLYEQIGLGSESDRYSQLYEVGRPIAVGGRIVGYRGGVENMIKLDQAKTEHPMVVVPNNL